DFQAREQQVSARSARANGGLAEARCRQVGAPSRSTLRLGPFNLRIEQRNGGGPAEGGGEATNEGARRDHRRLPGPDEYTASGRTVIDPLPALAAHATSARWPRPSASTTCAWIGAVCAFTASEPKAAPTTVRAGRLPLGRVTRAAMASATSCGFGASG